MPCRPALTQGAAVAAGLTAYERLLYHLLPSMLSSCGCEGARADLVAVLRDRRTEPDDLIDALDKAASFAVTQAAAQSPEDADRTERVAVLLVHLSQHEYLEGKAAKMSGYHLSRAMKIAEGLGSKLGPVGVVE